MSVDEGGSSKFYFIVSPSTSKQHKLNFTINGISRSVTKTLAFEAGKVTKFTVPINDLKHPHTSDALNLLSTGAENATGNKRVLDLGDAVKEKLEDQPTTTINGQANVPIYIVGDGAPGSITLRGTTKDIINALDAGFYATNWPGYRAAMTISNIQVYIGGVPLYDYAPLLEVVKQIIYNFVGEDKIFGYPTGTWVAAATAWAIAKPIFQLIIMNGIPRDGTFSLTRFVDSQTITFNGVVECGSHSNNSHILVLNEEHIYKGIDSNLINRFLNDRTHPMGGKFICGCGIKPTYQGLYDIVNNKPSAPDATNNNGKTYAENTSHAIYCKLISTLGDKKLEITSDYSIAFVDILETVFANEADLIQKLPSIEVEITISTCDYRPQKADYAGVNLADMQTTNNPIIFWGLDAYGPNKSSLSN